MKILITGGAGFIGSHLAEYFFERNHEITVLDNCLTGEFRNLKRIEENIELVLGDIRDEKLLERHVSGCDLVLHMAAALGVDNILRNPINSLSINIAGSEVVLKAAAKHKKRIVIASTSEVYGKNPKQPLHEDDDRVIGTPQRIRWTYSDAKAIEESIAHCLYKENGLRVTTLRFFNTVGPRQSGQYGMVLPRFVKAAMSNEPLRVFGDGSQSRVFCHVTDVVKAVAEILSHDLTIGEVYNVGGTEEISIKSLAYKVKEITNSDSPVEFVAYEKAYQEGFEDVYRRVPAISKIEAATGWKPEISLTQIIEDVSLSLKSN